MAECTLVEAVNLALARALADDPDVVVLGEDVMGQVRRPRVRLRRRLAWLISGSMAG